MALGLSEAVNAQLNQEQTVLASAARTTTQTSADYYNYGGRAVIVTLVTTVIGTGSVTVSIQGKDSASGTYVTLLTGAAVVTNTTNKYIVSPDLTAVANSIAKDHLTPLFRVVVTANNANSATYSVGLALVK